MELFGFELRRKKEEAEQKNIVSFAPPQNDDGAVVVSDGFGIYGTYVDLEGTIRTEAELVNKYRAISLDPVVDIAIQDVVNESIVEDSMEETISIVLEDIDAKDPIKKKIIEEFKKILSLLEFNRLSYEIFKRWYVDGRLFYHIIIDKNNPKKGILELRYVDPRHIRKVKKTKKEKIPNTNVELEKVVEEFYIFNKSGFLKKPGAIVNEVDSVTTQGLKIAKDSIAYCTSGYLNPNGDMILSYLHKAIRPLNMLKSMEDSLIIYRISRAPERRIFYVDVGGLPKAKAEQYLREVMTRFKNKVVYDSSTGEIRDDRKHMTMLEDFWLPRREGGRATEITTLPGGQNLGELDDVLYFQNLLYRSLNIPVTRLQPETAFTLGRATEISRDEVRFAKFITRLRNKFAELFTKILEKQLILKGICTPEDWKEWEDKIKYKYAIDNYFDELKNMEILRDRVGLVREMEEYIGRFYSNDYVRRYVLQQNQEEMKKLDAEIKKEKKDPRYKDIEDDGDGGMGFGSTEPPAPEPAPPPTPRPVPEPDSSIVPKAAGEKA
jgi:hypothetical protein